MCISFLILEHCKISTLIDCFLYCRMILNEMYTPAFVGLAVSGASDWVYSSSLVVNCLEKHGFES